MSARTCSTDACERDYYARGMCKSHYMRALSQGEIAPLIRPSLAERLAAGLVRMPNGCLEWTGSIRATDGYGEISGRHGKTLRTHRVAWELAHGPIPEGLHVLHHCDNPPCCDAEKCLFLGTDADNSADKMAKGRNRGNGNENKTHCPHGHEYAGANLYVATAGNRMCRTCMVARTRSYRAAKRSARTS